MDFNNKKLAYMGESEAIRCLAKISQFPKQEDYNRLLDDFFILLNTTDRWVNPPDKGREHIFAALIETIMLFEKCPIDEEEFEDNFTKIEQEVNRKTETLQELKKDFNERNIEYYKMFEELSADYAIKGASLLLEIVLSEKEFRQFLFTGLDIPLCYLVYFIAMDVQGHFSPLIRQAAMSSLRKAKEKYLWEKLCILRNDFLTLYGAIVPIVPDVTVDEFSHSIYNALELLGADIDYNSVFEIAYNILEKIPDSKSFLYQYPLKIIPCNGDALLTQQLSAFCYREWNDSRKEKIIKRTIEIQDYTEPNSRGIPAILFKNKDLVLPFIYREYIRSLGYDNEAEIRLRMARLMKDDFSISIPFVRTKNTAKAKELISTYLPFLEMYIQNKEVFESQSGQQITKDDIAMMIEKYFVLVELNEDSLLRAKIMLWYIEPLYSIFKINEANEEKLIRINEYIENIYGKPLNDEGAKQKALAVITTENKHITEMNNHLKSDTDILWQPLQDGSRQWKTFYNNLVKKYTRRNTLNIWELKGILYELNNKDNKKNNILFSKFGKWVQKTICKNICKFEDKHSWFIKVRKWIYDKVLEKLDKAEKSLDACGWKENNGECLRQDRHCCTIPFPSSCYTKKACNNRSLSCKFWLCNAALSRLSTTRKGQRFLTLRNRLSYWCIALNIPLKIRCSRNNAFNDNAKEPFADTTFPEWFNRPMKPAQEKVPIYGADTIRERRRFYKPPKPETVYPAYDEYMADWIYEPPKKADLKKRRIKIIIGAMFLLILTIYIFVIAN